MTAGSPDLVEDQTPLVSVVVATYNYACFLTEAVQSVQAQTCTEWECLIVDDASTDDTPAIAALLMNADRRIRYIRNHQNLGRSRSRNLGCEEARGIYVAFLDGDDWWMAGKLEGQLEMLRAIPEAVLCFTDVTVVSAEVESIFPCPGYWVHDVGSNLPEGNCICQSSVLALRSVIAELGGYDRTTETAEDWDLWIRLLQRHGPQAFAHLNQPVTFYRLHGSNSIGNWKVMNHGERLVVRRILRDWLWMLRHPLRIWRIINGQLEREGRRYEKAGLLSRALLCMWIRACLAPWKRWQWMRVIGLMSDLAQQILTHKVRPV